MAFSAYSLIGCCTLFLTQPESNINMASRTDVWIVAAIDFGTTYSGYVFSFSGDPLHFYSPQVWYSGQSGMSSMKTPTCLLLNPDKTFNSFGYMAEEKYASLAAEDDHHGYYFFQRFKMELHSKNVRKHFLLDDVSGKPLPALTVFSLSIKYLKDHCVQTMNDRGIGRSESEIKFVLTVPAIWNDHSKQFMRLAAIEAGIKDDHLVLALEPEAASIYCQRIPLENLKLGQGKAISVPGTKYLVADIGGGTADFSVHKVDEDGSLSELHRASGGPYGGIYVDLNYLKIYDIIFGIGVLDQLKAEDMEEFLSICREFENKKRSVTPEADNFFVTKLSAILNTKNTKEEKMRAIHYSFLRDDVSFVKDKLKLSPRLMKSFFKETLDQIITHVRNILERIPNIQTILIVGGYGESIMLQERFKREFVRRNIIIPNECTLAVMKGAVLFGHKPLLISSRVVRYSYGFETCPDFDPNIHPEEKRFLDEDGVERCKDNFELIIAKDTKVPSSGIEKSTVLTPSHSSQIDGVLRIYCTDETNPTIIRKSFQLLGELDISVPPHLKGMWKVEVTFVFGMTEIKVSAKVKETGETINTSFDLLE